VFGSDVYDAFVAKFTPDGGSLVYATFLGGSGLDEAAALAVDASGNAIVAGSTSSPDFPLTAGAIQKAAAILGTSGFVTRLNADGSDLLCIGHGGSQGDETENKFPAYVDIPGSELAPLTVAQVGGAHAGRPCPADSSPLRYADAPRPLASTRRPVVSTVATTYWCAPAAAFLSSNRKGALSICGR